MCDRAIDNLKLLSGAFFVCKAKHSCLVS